MTQEDRTTNKANNLTITENSAGQRIDNFLFNKLKDIPKTRIYRMLRKGEVRVNKKRISPPYKIQANDVIRIPPFWNEIAATKKEPGNNLVKLLLDSIIFEDDKILVINKPSGIASHSGSGIAHGVIEILRAARPDLENLELVHRIDRDTSGCLILAKTRAALVELHKLIREGKILKKYILLVRGFWKNGEQVINTVLSKNQSHSGEHIVEVSPKGKESITIFRPVKTDLNMSLLEAELKTGRTHQIRVHATHIGYPIAGDKKYGDKKFNKEMKALGINRLFLHAKEMRFTWSDGTKVNLVVPLDVQLVEVMSQVMGIRS
jgi:23S rRNA pseudouridine955/2504/2580 synthase